MSAVAVVSSSSIITRRAALLHRHSCPCTYYWRRYSCCCLLVILLCWASSDYYFCFTATDALALPIASSSSSSRNRNKENLSNHNNRNSRISGNNNNKNTKKNKKKNTNSRRQESLEAGRDPLLSLNLNLDALARSASASSPDSGSSGAAERCEELYCRIAALHAEGYYDVRPDIVSFNSVLKAWSAHGDPARALEFWERQAGRLRGRGQQLNARSYNTFLLALARAGMAAPAEQLLRQMIYSNAAVRPDRISYNTVLLAHATRAAAAAAAAAIATSRNDEEVSNEATAAAEPSAAQRAEALLQEMIAGELAMGSGSSSSGDDDDETMVNDKHTKLPPVVDPNYFPPRPDATSFNTVIAAWANSAAHFSGAGENNNNNKRQQQHAAAERAEGWLRRMQQQQQDDDVEGVGVEPDTHTYATVLQAWRRAGGPVAVDRALALLSELERGGDGGDDDGSTIIAPATTKSSSSSRLPLLAQPNRVLYTTVLQILSENGHPERAHALFQQRMVNSGSARLQPDAVAFAALMNGWAVHAGALSRSSNDDDNNHNDDDDNLKQREQAVAAVMELLRQMQDLALTLPELAPTALAHTAVLKTLAAARLHDAGARAKRVLREMNNPGRQQQQPGLIHFNAALDCCAKAPRATKALDAAEIWEGMMPQAGCRPDAITYNTVLNAAANAFGSRALRRDSFDIGRRAFAALQADPDCDATSLTYSYYFKMLRRLMADDDDDGGGDNRNNNGHRRFELVQEAFDLCCEQGCLNELIWKRVMQMVASEDKRNELLGGHFAACQKHKWQFTSLPPEWSRCAMRDRRKRRRPRPSLRKTSDALAK